MRSSYSEPCFKGVLSPDIRISKVKQKPIFYVTRMTKPNLLDLPARVFSNILGQLDHLDIIRSSVVRVPFRLRLWFIHTGFIIRFVSNFMP